MRTILLAIVAVTLPMPSVLAKQPAFPKPENATRPANQLPVKGADSANSCAAFGAGFVKVAGTDTCVKVGGAVSIGVGAER